MAKQRPRRSRYVGIPLMLSPSGKRLAMYSRHRCELALNEFVGIGLAASLGVALLNQKPSSIIVHQLHDLHERDHLGQENIVINVPAEIRDIIQCIVQRVQTEFDTRMLLKDCMLLAIKEPLFVGDASILAAHDTLKAGGATTLPESGTSD